MTTTQITGMRMLAEAMKGQSETKTARDMATTAHRLSGKNAAFATTGDGQKFAWHNGLELWIRCN